MLRLELGTVRNTELGLLDPLSQEGFVTIILSILIALLLFYFFFSMRNPTLGVSKAGKPEDIPICTLI